MRILGLDYGSKTVGVAVSDPLGVTAQRLETIWRKQENKLRRTLAQVEELVKEYLSLIHILDRMVKDMYVSLSSCHRKKSAKL